MSILVPACLAVMAAGVAFAAEKTVESVSVQLEYLEHEPPDHVRIRNHNSAAGAAAQAFAGKRLLDVEARLEYYRVLLDQVLEDVLRGYIVVSVKIELGVQIEVRLELAPRGEVVERVTVEIPEWVLPWFAEPDKARLKQQIATIAPMIKGLPVAADWALDTVIAAIHGLRLNEDFFLGYRVEPRIQMGTTAVVSLRIEPVGDRISGISVKVRSTSLPNMVLEESKFLVSTRLGALLGASRDFITRHQERIVQVVEEAARESRLSDHVHIEASAVIDFRRDLVVHLTVDSPTWRVQVEGFIDVGRNTGEESELRGHLGRVFPTGTEIFGRPRFFPGPIKFRGDLGIGQFIGNDFYFAAGREIIDGVNRIWGHWSVSPDVTLVWEEDLDNKLSEGGARFRFHDFFSFSFLTDFRSDYYLRCLVNL